MNIRGQRDSTGGKALVLHVVHTSLIPGTTYDLPKYHSEYTLSSEPGESPENLQVKSKYSPQRWEDSMII